MRCSELELEPPVRKGIAVTRSFGESVTTLADMLQATTFYATPADEELRRHGVLAPHLSVFFHTGEFRDGPSRSVSGLIQMRERRPTRLSWCGAHRR